MTNQTARQSGNGMSLLGEIEPRNESQVDQLDPTAGELSPATSPVKVLLVEDSHIVRERLAAMVAELGNVVIVGKAGNGFQAVALFRQHRPDVVVLDIQLPGINGLDLLAQFKLEYPGCVVMVLTTYAFKEFRQRCAALGADHFFDKCTEFERVTEVLSAFQPRRALRIGN